MATVPGILWIGGYHAAGGNPGLNAVADGTMQSNLRHCNDRDVSRIVPDNAAGDPIAASTGFYPWFDPFYGATNYTVGSSTTTTIVASGSPGWATNQFAGRVVTIRNTTPLPFIGFAARFFILSNTANTLTFAAQSSAPTVGASFFIGDAGAFTDYHPVAGHLVVSEFNLGQPSVRCGSTPYSFGVGVGPDATFIRRAWIDVYSAPPYFHCWKLQTASPVHTHWGDSPNDLGRANFLLEFARVVSAASAIGNTIAWQWCIIDLAELDIAAATSNPPLILLYKPRLEQMMAWIRSSAVTNNSALKFIFVNHSQLMWGITGVGGISYTNGVHREIRSADSLVHIMSMEDGRIGNHGDAPNAEAKWYSQASYFDYGDRLAATMVRASLGIPATTEGGFPVYLMIGDSIFTGAASASWTTLSNSPDISGPTVGSLLRPANQLIYDDGASAFEVYEPHANSNTSGSIGTSAGPDLSIMAELGRLHPDGFGLIKRASNGSALAALASAYSGGNGGRWSKSFNEHYVALQALVAGATQYVNETMDKQVDMRGCFVSLGTNDQSVAGGGELFADSLPTFASDLWNDFSTRTSGEKFPIVWRRPQSEFNGKNETRLAEVRAALAAMAEQDPQFVPIDVDDLERDKVDNLHETPESAVTGGRRYVAAMQLVAI